MQWGQPQLLQMAVKDVTHSPTHYPGIVRTGIALHRIYQRKLTLIEETLVFLFHLYMHSSLL